MIQNPFPSLGSDRPMSLYNGCKPAFNRQGNDGVFVLSGYEYLLGFLIICSLVPVLALTASKLLRPSSRGPERRTTYESGMEPVGGAWIQFNIRYYMFALVFVIFDVETVFLYPWAVAFHTLGVLAFIEALIFIAILVVGLVYAWRKGALEWS
jgi:NAD(P)H-quinone oxidoreductase subunit 3